MIVLVIDDEATWPSFYRDLVKPGVTVVHAWTLDEGKELFHQYQGAIKMIIIDGHVRAPLDATIETIRSFIEEAYFTGPIVAASADWTSSNKMVAAGCEHAWKSKFPDREEAHEHYPDIFAQFPPRR